ncbi:hypothetical protein OOK60_15390 [Trichothermofontia sichuanensis B231]|uniref:hypothetical protein n=1 Tax=Trichothermofontia sichuanensis TaxID=3045816 RepID=UPI002247EE18|nr:hypothetical protein [Trichothermofontia sichuanensis]UZQ53859.1 hypothetical protein OOK60_15390 [Trichothermofontia sichuanensis B231]
MEGIAGEAERLPRQRRHQLAHDLNFAGLLVIHHLSVQHHACLLAEGRYGHHPVLISSTVIGQLRRRYFSKAITLEVSGT